MRYLTLISVIMALHSEDIVVVKESSNQSNSCLIYINAAIEDNIKCMAVITRIELGKNGDDDIIYPPIAFTGTLRHGRNIITIGIFKMENSNIGKLCFNENATDVEFPTVDMRNADGDNRNIWKFNDGIKWDKTKCRFTLRKDSEYFMYLDFHYIKNDNQYGDVIMIKNNNTENF